MVYHSYSFVRAYELGRLYFQYLIIGSDEVAPEGAVWYSPSYIVWHHIPSWPLVFHPRACLIINSWAPASELIEPPVWHFRERLLLIIYSYYTRTLADANKRTFTPGPKFLSPLTPVCVTVLVHRSRSRLHPWIDSTKLRKLSSIDHNYVGWFVTGRKID